MLNIFDVQMLTGTQRNIATASNTQAQKLTHNCIQSH